MGRRDVAAGQVPALLEAGRAIQQSRRNLVTNALLRGFTDTPVRVAMLGTEVHVANCPVQAMGLGRLRGGEGARK